MAQPRSLVLRFSRTLDAEDSRGSSAGGEESSTAAMLRLSREGGEVETSDERDFARWIELVGASRGDPIILDLSGNTFATSARIAVMLKLWRAVGPDWPVSIVAPDPLMANVLKRCHIDRLIPIFASLDEARADPQD
jgi:anti-anti-sigma regulatory factor